MAAVEPAVDIAIPVEGVPVVRGTLRLSVSAAGEAIAFREAVVPALAEGRIVRLRVRENDRVIAGEEVATIDPAEHRLELDEAEVELARANASFREMTLLDERIRDARVRSERAAAGRVRSGLAAAEVRVARAELNLSRTIARAPFAGRIASIRAGTDQWVRAGDQLLRVVAIDSLRVEAQVLDGDRRWLERGNAATVEFAALPGEIFPGRIESVNPVVDRELRTVKVVVVVPNPDARALPGMYARVSLETRQLSDRILVPREAILERERRSVVFVYAADGSTGRARWRRIVTGLGDDRVVELVEVAGTDPVEPGEVVLTAGHHSLIHDARVRLVD